MKNTILVTKLNSWGVTLIVDGKRVVMRQGELLIDGKVIHQCRFCGRDFDDEEYIKTMCEQAPSRDPSYFRATGAKYCGLYCAWLNDEAFCRRQLQQEKIEEMKEDVAKRVSKYIEKDRKGVK